MLSDDEPDEGDVTEVDTGGKGKTVGPMGKRPVSWWLYKHSARARTPIPVSAMFTSSVF
jgi:hypothetical protein